MYRIGRWDETQQRWVLHNGEARNNEQIVEDYANEVSLYGNQNVKVFREVSMQVRVVAEFHPYSTEGKEKGIEFLPFRTPRDEIS